MNFLEELGRAIDPEAFNDDAFDVQELADRRQKILTGLTAGFGKLDQNFKVVRLPVPSYDGDFYEIDGYSDGKGRSLALNARSLGEFMVKLIQMKGTLVSSFCMSPEYKNAHVSVVVRLHPDRKAEFEAATNLKLKEPSRFVPA